VPTKGEVMKTTFGSASSLGLAFATLEAVAARGGMMGGAA
jgi:hypothetical protein